MPALFLNSTEPDTGQRIVNSHVVIDPGFSSALSLPNRLATESLRLSTAVLLSARFPAISPIGSLKGDSKSGPVHIVDGGYVDNSGTLTAKEVAEALVRSAARLGLRKQIRIVAVVITDDPIVPETAHPGTYQGAGSVWRAARRVPCSRPWRRSTGPASSLSTAPGRI